MRREGEEGCKEIMRASLGKERGKNQGFYNKERGENEKDAEASLLYYILWVWDAMTLALACCNCFIVLLQKLTLVERFSSSAVE